MVPAESHASLFHLCSHVHTLLLVFSHASLCSHVLRVSVPVTVSGAINYTPLFTNTIMPNLRKANKYNVCY